MATKMYQIQAVDNCFLVKKTGVWSLATDLHYISDLSDALDQRQGTAFYLLVDMRGVTVPQHVKNNKEKYPVIVDRRNQKGEIWLLDDPNQADHLLRYFDDVTFALKQTTERDKFLSWLRQRLAPRTMDAVINWLDEKKSV